MLGRKAYFRAIHILYKGITHMDSGKDSIPYVTTIITQYCDRSYGNDLAGVTFHIPAPTITGHEHVNKCHFLAFVVFNSEKGM